jgi:hypothetical protein
VPAKRCDYATPGHRCQQSAIYTVTYRLGEKQRRANRCGQHNGAASLPDGATQIEAEFVASDSWGGDSEAWKG